MKAKKMLIIAFILFLAFGFFMNSSFMNAKKNEVYGMLKEEYGLSSDTDTKEEIEQQEIESTEEVAQTDVKVTSRGSSNEKRSNENIVWDYLIEQGYSAIQVAGIIGNMYQESGVNPAREETNGIGYGLVQWSFGRRQQLEAFAESKGKPVSDIYVQLEFLVKELKSGKQLYGTYADQFNNPYSVDDATEAFCWGFERPNKNYANMANRKAKAWENLSAIYMYNWSS